MKKFTQKHRHIASRIIVLAVLLFVTVLVIFALSSNMVRQDFSAFKYSFNNFKNRIEEELFHPYNGIPELSSNTKTHTLPVLLYHGIGDDKSPYTLTQDQFRDQMIALKDAGYQSIDADTYIAYMQGKIDLPEKSVLITFDDGRKDSYYGADPILAQLNLHAVMFIAVGQSLSPKANDSTYYLDTAEVKQMVASGHWDIGSHAMQDKGGYVSIDAKGTQGYFLSNKMWLPSKGRMETESEYETRINYELNESKAQIQAITGKKNILMSYPFSDYGTQSINNKANAENVIESIVAKDYVFAFRQLTSPNNGFSANSPLDNPHLMKRIEMQKTIPNAYLITVLNSSIDLAFQTKTIVGKDLAILFSRWHNIGGNIPTISNNVLNLTANATAASSLTIFDGTRNWTDYMFSIHTAATPPQTIALLARVSDATNSGVRCLWTGNSVRIIENSVNISDGSHSFTVNNPYGPITTYGIAVKGNTVGCYENDHLVAGLEMTHTGTTGGLGVQVWENGTSAATLKIDSFSFAKATVTLADVALLQTMKPHALVQAVSTTVLDNKLTSFAIKPRYATGTSIISQDPDAFIQDPYGYANAIYSFQKDSYTMTVGGVGPVDSGAEFEWPRFSVRDGQEYSVEGSYSSTAPVELKAKFVSQLGVVNYVLITTLPPSGPVSDFRLTVPVVEGAQFMTIFESMPTAGSITTLSPRIYLLQDGKFNQPMITLNFDDGRKTYIDNAFPLLQQYHMSATLAIITSATGWENYMSPGDIFTAWQAGDEVAAHTRDHVHLNASLSKDQLVNEIVGSWYDLQTAGFPTDTFVYPYGDYSPEAETIASQRFLGARSVMRGFNTRNTDPYALQDQLVDKTITQAQLQDWINTAKQNNSWLILEMHNVNTQPTPTDVEGITTAQLTMVLKTIQAAGIKVVTTHDGLVQLRAN